MDDSFWRTVMEVKTAVNKELELQRNEKRIGSALSAEATLYCEEALSQALAQLGDELRFVLMVSQARIAPLESAAEGLADTEVPGLRLQIAPSAHRKCVRCWHHRSDVGAHQEHPELCGRCVDNVSGSGELRRYA